MKKWLLLLCLLLIFPVRADAASVSGKAASQTSVKISLKGKTQYKYWRIRRIIYGEYGGTSGYKKIKLLKTSTKKYVVKKLKKNTEYSFEIAYGNKKDGKFKPELYDYVYNVFTGISRPSWDDYAASDAKFSTTYIDLWGFRESYGLTAKGIQIYRKVKGGSYKKIKTIKKKSFTFRDKKVKKGKTYYYRMRSYGTYKGKKIYSPWSETLKRFAGNRVGKFTSKIISPDMESVEIKLTSDKYNAALKMSPDAFFFRDGEEEEEVGLKITKYSLDGKAWKKPEKITLKAGQSIYLILEANGTQDLRDLEKIESDNVTYDGWPCFFYLDLNGTGSTPHNDEFIH